MYVCELENLVVVLGVSRILFVPTEMVLYLEGVSSIIGSKMGTHQGCFFLCIFIELFWSTSKTKTRFYDNAPFSNIIS